MRLRLFLLLAILALVAAACGPAATPTGAPSPAAPASPESVRIDVALNEMTIEPAEMSVPAGQPVTFVVTNVGTIEHEFFVGDEEEQQHHEAEMAAEGGMQHDEPNAISVEPGATEELTMTFPEAGTTLAGCHVPGHYPAGMKATIVIES
jgi:uncharacterized cupredoxin-like copper-binding protein